MIDYTEYIGYDVEIIDKNDYVYKGELLTYYNGLDEEPPVEYDSLCISIGPSSAIQIPIPDIKEFKVLYENMKEILIDDTKTYEILYLTPEECDKALEEARKEVAKAKEKEK